MSALRSDRAPGLDYVTAESPELHEEMLKVLNAVYVSSTMPQEWHLSTALVPTLKEGHLSMQTNNRGITLMSTTTKLYTQVLNRICNTLDSHFRPNQNSFNHTDRSTTQHMLALRHLIKVFQTKQLNFIITFIDFKSVIRWTALESILAAYGIPEKLCKER